jgi:transposase
MALGRRGGVEDGLWIPTTELPRSPGHPFYERVNRVLAEAGFDRFVEDLCRPHYATVQGRPSIPPGTYFRMLMVGYFEGIDSQRGIAWRCSDSLALREFLGLAMSERAPDHSSLTVIRQRLPLELHEEVFAFVLRILVDRGLYDGKTLAVDATMLEANAAMKSIVRRDSGEGWKQYIKRLAQEAGIENPTEEDARRLDRKRKKRVSNQDWESKTDPESRIAKMKDGRTHLAYKAEHVIDLESEVVVAATIYPADRSDGETLLQSVSQSQEAVARAGSDAFAAEVVADKGYHKAQTLAECAAYDLRTYVPERAERRPRRWTDKPAAWRDAFRANRRRVRGERSRRLQRLRSERVERSFAHVCNTGRARRTWLRGIEDVHKRYLVTLAGRNLTVLMRALFGIGTPRGLQGLSAAVFAALCALLLALSNLHTTLRRLVVSFVDHSRQWLHGLRRAPIPTETRPSSTGCYRVGEFSAGLPRLFLFLDRGS